MRNCSRRSMLRGLMVTGVALSGVGCSRQKAGSASVPPHGETDSDAQASFKTIDGIAQVRLRGRAGLWNVGIQNGRISRISQSPITGNTVLSGDGRVLTEGLVEHHMHLDKVLTVDRYKWDEATLAAERQRWEKDRAAGKTIRGFTVWRENQVRHTYTEDDVFRRALEVVKIESANGTTTMRTHCCVDEVRTLDGLRGLLRLREAVRPYMDLQISLHPQDGLLLRDPNESELIRRGLELGADGVGGIPEVEPVRTDEYIDTVFRLAKEHGKFVDIHADQARDITFSPPIMVAKTRKYGLQGQVTVSHGFSLAFQPREKVLPVLDQMKEEGVALACAPTSVLEERVRIPRSRGVLVSIMIDNVGDPWNRGVRADLIEAATWYRRGARVGSSDEALEEVFDLITTCPAKALGLKDHGLREGARADLVLFDAQSVPQALADQSTRAFVLKDGQVVAQGGRCLWSVPVAETMSGS